MKKKKSINMGNSALIFFDFAIHIFIHNADRKGIALMRHFHDAAGERMREDEINNLVRLALIAEGRLLGDGRACA